MRSVVLVAVLAACPSKPVDHPKPVDDTALRIKIANLEAVRGDGLDPLIELANNGDQPTKLLALRGLGRIGGTKALATLTAALGDPDAAILDTAAQAIGIATSLDEETAGQPAITKALLDAHAKRPDDEALVEAIGRAAESSAQSVLVVGLRGTPAIAVASAVALGRFGRRKIEWLEATRSAVIAATRHPNAQVRLAASYALAREHLVKPEEKSSYLADSGTALAALIGDPDPAIRAQVVQALVRRKLVGAHQRALVDAGHDPDWRVAVEAIRGLTAEASTQEAKRLGAFIALYWLSSIDGGRVGEQWVRPIVEEATKTRDRVVLSETLVVMQKLGNPGRWTPVTDPSGAHVVIEALRGLSTKDDRVVAAAVAAINARISASTKLPELTRAWIGCLGAAANARSSQVLAEVTTCRLPDHLRFPIAGELIAAKVGTLEARREVLQPMLASKGSGRGPDKMDPRVRVAGMTALASMWSEGSAADHEAVVAMTIAALADKEGIVAGTGVETAEKLYEELDKSNETALRERLDAALLSRAQTEQDAELATSLFGVIGKRKLVAGAPACRHGVRGAPVLAKAAIDCLKSLGETIGDEPLAIAVAKAPPVDVTAVINKVVRWKLTTTRGDIVIELRPDIAPWAVATIVALTRKQYYDGLELHRVVPNFVAQGGDPTQSGWGGPGFAIPAEPSAGYGYTEGGVGMADAGRDSAGSQWFIMHSPAPHLDGRYTWVGRVVTGQSAANSLLIGDRVLTATVDLQNRP